MTDFARADAFGLFATLTPEQERRRARLREALERDVAPGVNEAWLAGRTPESWPRILGGLADEVLFPGGFAWPPPDPLFAGLAKLELGRVDASIATFYGVHAGLAMAAIQVFGSDEQRARWIPSMARFERIGSFSLSEPETGSDVARGLRTTATRDGEGWVLEGTKKWSGNAPIADLHVVLARTDNGTDNGRGMGAFVLERDAPGLEVERIEDKIAKRAVENATVHLRGCRVLESARLPGVASFHDVTRALSVGRFTVAFEATGVAMGALEAARRYALERDQFGRPIASFQLVQDKLVRMAAEVTSMQCTCFRMADLALSGELAPELPALGKVICAGGMRRVVALGRELFGGNGILLGHGVARAFADAEAVYSYEGTQDINTLIVGRALTGISAFT